ncbi:hypothetical protein H0243_14265 [Staphylococcus sciuri]|uniref:hypothetical protein n=1 Tax=Mammaliicoccus sciuri TaxID=1296 RepID=UPI0018C96E48|nr:hypothetical protein [Mammaliicoccus sciuri]MBG9206955.1 hypothetical protein [Mammaliicoccus sciuri]
MTSFIWLPIILSLVCLFIYYLVKEVPPKVGLRKSIKNRLEKRIIVSEQIKKAILYLIGLILIYSMFYSVLNIFLLLENTLEGNAIIQPELKKVELNEGKAQTLLSTMLMSYIILSTFFAGGFIRSATKSVVGIIKNRNLDTANVKRS